MTTIPPGAGLCVNCRHVKPNQTKRGSLYLRCLRAAWDPRLRQYPTLPVLTCVGFEPNVDGSAEPAAPTGDGEA